MLYFRPARLSLLIVVLLLATQACGILSASTPTSAPSLPPAHSPTGTPPPAPEPTPTPIPDPASLCPVPGKDQSLYVSKDNGFCLLIPQGFSIQPDTLRPGEVLSLLGPRESDKPKTQEEISVSMTIAYNGPADGLDSASYARKWHGVFGGDAPYQDQTVTIGGQPAVVLSDLPGYARQRGAFLVANGIKYQITLFPQPEDMPELAEAATRGWETVTGSIVFFPPQNQREVRRAADVCPKETSEMRLYLSDTDGYCFLYPSDFAPDPAFPGMIKGGPVLGQWDGGDIVTYVALGTFGHVENQTPRQVLEPRMDQIDSASVKDATLGGYPAVTFLSLQGPWPSRQAMIVVNGDVYTIVGEPWDPHSYPLGVPYLDRLWEAVTGSLAFFDPWR